MKKRLPYIISFILLFAAEPYIGAFVRDDFIRPYGGDILVTVLLCCLAKIFFPGESRKLPAIIFAFSAAAEFLQLMKLPEKLGFSGTAAATVLGTTFDWKDLVCYLLGCILFYAVDRRIIQKSGVQ